MYRPGAHHSAPDSRNATEIDNRTWPSIASGVAKNAALLANESEPKGVREQLTGELVGIQPKRDGIDATYRVLGGHSSSRPSDLRVGCGMCNELAHESLVILEGDYSFVLIASDGLLELDTLLYQSLDPEPDGAGEDRKGRNGDLAAALSATTRVGPGKERQDTSWSALLVAEIEVVRRRV